MPPTPRPRKARAAAPAASAAAKGQAQAERFTGFHDATMSFFRRLAKNQDRDWFGAHKAEYVEGWQRPMEALLAEVRARVDSDFEYVDLAEPKVFRIHKDTRFARDKTPYKTHVAGLVMARTGGAAKSAIEVPAALYLSVGVGEGANLTGHGQYAMSPEQLTRFRAALLDDKRGAEVGRIVAALTRAGFRLEAAETLKKVPRGVDPEHPRADLLRMKGLVAMGPEVPAELLTSAKLVDHLARQTRKAAELVRWLLEL